MDQLSYIQDTVDEAIERLVALRRSLAGRSHLQTARDIARSHLSTRVLTTLLAALVALAVARSGALSLSSGAGYVLNGYFDETLATVLVLGSVLLAALSTIALVVQISTRRLRAIAGSLALLVGALTLLLGVFVTVGLSGTKWPYSTVYSNKRSAYYVLCDALVLTDTAFEVARTPSLWWPLWSKAFDPLILDYSEDGSLISDPRLILSGDESILVISRGGELTDAVDLDRSENLVDLVDWSEPGREREAAWALRTSQVNEILRIHADPTR